MAEREESTASPASASPHGLPRFPDFFVVGAPRCGTTSLSHYLSRHPAVCFSRPKEPHYFSGLAVRGGPREHWRAEYARFFRHYDPARHHRVGEGSVSYLYAEEALRRIRDLNPMARFVAMVRNPLEMVPSFHLRLLFLLEEDVADFAAAWELQPVRARGRRIPRLCTDPRLLQYGAVGRLGVQVERLYRIGGPDRCLVVLFDDFVHDPAAVYRRVLEFLELEDDGRTEFPRRQPSRHYRSRWLQRLLYKPPGAVAELLGERIARSDHKLRRLQKQASAGSRPTVRRRRRKPLAKRVYKDLRRWNRVVAAPAPLDPALRARLREHFAADVEKLAKILDRDLGHWR
jgi:hypothetical protein